MFEVCINIFKFSDIFIYQVIFTHLYIYYKSYHKTLCSSISFLHWTLLSNWKYFSVILMLPFMSTMTFYVISEPQFKRKRRKQRKENLLSHSTSAHFLKLASSFVPSRHIVREITKMRILWTPISAMLKQAGIPNEIYASCLHCTYASQNRR